MHETAGEFDDFGTIEETLKWCEPSFVTKNGPLRLTFKEFREARVALAEIRALTGGGE